MPAIEMVAEPELSHLAFRYTPAGITSEAELEAKNKLLLGAVNDEQRVFLTAATVRGRFFIRICVLSFRTHRDRIDACLEDLRAGLARLSSVSRA
jgi:aromatic-L-amino-acid decarboxylase